MFRNVTLKLRLRWVNHVDVAFTVGDIIEVAFTMCKNVIYMAFTGGIVMWRLQ